ncbi:serine/threonine-protein kinase [Labedaea rhizosphaerae]|uniref:non-specific serine/threonine protein kinase n=1 Tax=Labedaea rhizosphaerae TaxID=598644 RepID=A0A4V3CZX3_LABRH|nr:serine/threonine-protein kinase [Labedaea rhizosphaerae]TDQ01401.1 serine/threonine protein kinase [Labedaea rhizosphaerae]
MTLELGTGAVLPGGYRISERIGSGGMGVVFRAVHQDSGKTVAIKLLRPGSTDRRFREEGRVLARLDHPGLVAVLDEGEYRDRPFLVLAYVPGPTLRELLELGPMRPGEVARIGADLARTLAYVHGQDIVHRDVKPSNILITQDGRPVLNDFGVSYRQGRTRWTQSGFVNGTAAYLAPEQVKGQPPSAALDVYALGLVLLECLSGFPEYDGTAIECALARLHRTPRRPHNAPDWLSDVLLRMTATDPAQRPTAAQAAELLSSEGQVAVLAPNRRQRARTALLAGAATVAAAGLVTAAWLPASSSANTSGEPVPGQFAPVVADPPGTIRPTTGNRVVPAAETVAAHDNAHPPTQAQHPKPAPEKTAPKTQVKTQAKTSPPSAQPGHGPGSGKGKGKGDHVAGSPSSDPAT